MLETQTKTDIDFFNSVIADDSQVPFRKSVAMIALLGGLTARQTEYITPSWFLVPRKDPENLKARIPHSCIAFGMNEREETIPFKDAREIRRRYVRGLKTLRKIPMIQLDCSADELLRMAPTRRMFKIPLSAEILEFPKAA